MADILSTLAQMLTPSSAEAKIRGTPDAMALVQSLRSEAEAGQGTYWSDMVRRIYDTAEARPETVNITPESGLVRRKDITGGFQRSLSGEGSIPAYNIVYDPSLPRPQLQTVLPHELLHFLSRTSTRPQSDEVQHALIRVILGEGTKGEKQRRWPERYGPYQPIRPFEDPATLTPVEHDIIRSWFGGE